MDKFKELRLRFTSGNSVEVDSIRLYKSDYKQLQQEYDALASYCEELKVFFKSVEDELDCKFLILDKFPSICLSEHAAQVIYKCAKDYEDCYKDWNVRVRLEDYADQIKNTPICCEGGPITAGCYHDHCTGPKNRYNYVKRLFYW